MTPDKRFPAGTSRAAQNAVSVPGTFANATGVITYPFWRNRPSGEDQPVDPFGTSMYDFWRSRVFNNTNGRTGNYPVMTASEIRLLSAEGNIRCALGFATTPCTGTVARAMTLINVSRVAAGLPGLAAITDTLTAIPGTNCVPRVPSQAANFRASKCGNIWDAMKYEYRLETAYTGYGMWFFAGRGWGDIPAGTALDWAVPWEELYLRQKPIYGTGGGGYHSAGPGSYGLFDGGVYGW